MSYFKDVWSNLVFNAGNATSQFVSSLNWRYQNNQMGGNIEYKSQSAYKSVLVHVAKQLAMSTLEGELNSLLPKYQKYVRDKSLKEMRAQQMENRATLIENGQKSTEGFGAIDCEGGHRLIAKDRYGTPIPEALMLHYDLPETEQRIHYTDAKYSGEESYVIKDKNTLEKLWNPGNEIVHTSRNVVDDSFDSRTVFHIDLAPRVSMSSTKNVILTTVQGRDFTRKELVSGGDMTYTVNGSIVSDQAGVYPSEAVKRFVKIMQYNGIINVNFITFGLLGVTRIIIKGFFLGEIEYKNIQPYSFTCVAVEPDDAITLQADTINAINKELQATKWDAWYHQILQNKLGEMAAKTALGAATSSITSLTGAGLDELTSNI